MGEQKNPLMSMAGRAEGKPCADPGILIIIKTKKSAQMIEANEYRNVTMTTIIQVVVEFGCDNYYNLESCVRL